MAGDMHQPDRLSATQGRGDAASSLPFGGVFQELHPALAADVAVVEAERCLECGSITAMAPCTVACPADVDVPGFIAQIVDGNPEKAADIIFSANPLGGSCARVCPTEVLCEGACVLETAGRRPVTIGQLQRFATDAALAAGTATPQRAALNGRRVAVIGAGPAGLACAATLAPLGYEVEIFDARAEVGGLIRYAIAPYRQVREPLPQEAERLAAMGVQIHLNAPIRGREDLRRLESEFDAVFLGVGLGEDADVRYEGDDLAGVYESLPFIEAVKDGLAPQVGRRVAVIGGGNTAMDCAREALRLGAEDVVVLYRRTESEMPAWRHEVLEAKEDGVRFVWLSLPVAFLGDGHVSVVRCERMELGEPDESGRRRPQRVPGSAFDLPVDTVIKAVGQRYRTGFLAQIPGLQHERGPLEVDGVTGQTGNPKFFAGGDAVNGGGTAVEAVHHGKVAAMGIDRYLRGLAR